MYFLLTFLMIAFSINCEEEGKKSYMYNIEWISDEYLWTPLSDEEFNEQKDNFEEVEDDDFTFLQELVEYHRQEERKYFYITLDIINNDPNMVDRDLALKCFSDIDNNSYDCPNPLIININAESPISHKIYRIYRRLWCSRAYCVRYNPPTYTCICLVPNNPIPGSAPVNGRICWVENFDRKVLNSISACFEHQTWKEYMREVIKREYWVPMPEF